jgi:UDP-N-acetylmuramate dehydrogenase
MKILLTEFWKYNTMELVGGYALIKDLELGLTPPAIFENRKMIKKFEENVLLKDYTSFKIGGPARYFFKAKTKQDLIEAIQTAKQNGLPFFILGGGSNLLVSDKGYDHLVIKMENARIDLFDNSESSCSVEAKENPKIYVEAGAALSSLVVFTTENNLTGMEWAAGIPGTVGGAIVGNAGAFGMSMSSVAQSVEAIDIEFEKTKIFENQDCEFEYRNSIFKQGKDLIIFSAILEMERGDKEKIQKATKEFLDSRASADILFPSAGSVFKNPKGYFAGELIEKCGLKGKKIGDIQISETHCNFFVNLGDGKASDVLELIKLAKQSVKEKFGIDLQEEIIVL